MKHLIFMVVGAGLGFYIAKAVTVGGQIQGTPVNLTGAAAGAWVGWYLARKF